MYSRFLSRFKDFKFIAGHNRWSTKGASNTANAHPFQHGDITLVHNGTVNAHNFLIEGKQSFTVDSEAVCFAINEQGIEKVIPKIDGAFALIWHDDKDDSINFIRNDERPFVIAKVKGKDAIVGASEVKMLEWIAGRNHIPIEKPYELEEGVLLSFKSTFVKSAVKKKLPLKPAVPTYGGRYYGSSYSSSSRQPTYKPYQADREKFKTETGLSKGDIIDVKVNKMIKSSTSNSTYVTLYGSYRDPLGVHYPVREYAVPIADLGGIKVNDYVAAEVNDFFTNSGKDNHFSSSKFYISVKGASDVDLFVKKHLNFDDPVVVDGNKKATPSVKTPKPSNAVKVIPHQPRSPDDNVPRYHGPRSKHITAKKWDALTKNGCAYCSGDVLPRDDIYTLWTHDDQPICRECATIPEALAHVDDQSLVF